MLLGTEGEAPSPRREGVQRRRLVVIGLVPFRVEALEDRVLLSGGMPAGVKDPSTHPSAGSSLIYPLTASATVDPSGTTGSGSVSTSSMPVLAPALTTDVQFAGVDFSSSADLSGLQGFFSGTGGSSLAVTAAINVKVLNQSFSISGLSVAAQQVDASLIPTQVAITFDGVDLKLQDGGGNTVVEYTATTAPFTIYNTSGHIGLTGDVSGAVTANAPGLSLAAPSLDLSIDTTAASPTFELKGSVSNLAIAGQSFTGPSGANFDFTRNGTTGEVDVNLDGLSAGIGGLVTLSDLKGGLNVSKSGVKGFVSGSPSFTTSTVQTSATALQLNFDTTVSPAQVQVSGQQATITAGGQSLKADFVIQNAPVAGGGNELQVGINNLTAFFGSPDQSTGVNITGGYGAMVIRSGGFALDAGGGAQLLGVNGLQLSGTLDLQTNTTGAAISESITAPGQATPTKLEFSADQPLAVQGTADLGVVNFVTLHGGFSFTKQEVSATETKFLVGAGGIDAFIGSGDETTGIGAKISGATLGLVVLHDIDPVAKTSNTTYALNAGGSAALVGLAGLDVSGSLSVQVNNTGAPVDEPISVPNPAFDPTKPAGTDNPQTIDTSVSFTAADNVKTFGGSVTLSIANAFSLSGNVSFTKDQTTGGADISIPTATLGLISGGQTVVSVTGSADFTIDSTDGFKLKDAQLTDFSFFGVDAHASSILSNHGSSASDTPAPAPLEGKAGTTGDVGAGPIIFHGPSVGIGSFDFNGGKLLASIDIGVQQAGLRFGTGNAGGTDTSGDQSKSGVSVVLNDLAGTFQLSVDTRQLAVAPTGKFGFSIGSLTATVPNVLTITAPSTSVTNPNGPAIQVNYDPSDANADDPLVTIDSADINVPKVGVTGTIQPFTPAGGGQTIPGLVITRNGFTLGQASITKSGPISLGSVLKFDDITVGVTNFGVNFHTGVQFNGSVKLSSSGASLFPDKAFSASITSRTPGVDALSADFQFTDGKFSDLVFNADKISVTLGKYLSLGATGVQIDTGAAGDATQQVAHFESVSAEVNVPKVIDLTGSAGNFDIMGDGSFNPEQNFSVSLGVGSTTGDTFKWPSWLPIHIDSVGLSWTDLHANPFDFVLSLSASVTQLQGVSGLTFSGTVDNIQIDLGKLEHGLFPIIGLDAAGITVGGDIFGGHVDATLIAGILRVGNDNTILTGVHPDSDVKTRIFYAGLDGGFSFGSVGGINLQLGLSQYGPLDVYLSANLPEGIVLDPDTGLAINNFSAGVSFFKTLPDLSQASDLSTLTFGNTPNLTAATWLPDLQQQVLNQYLNGGTSSFLSAFTSPLEISGSAEIFSIYTSQQAFNGQVSVAFSTDGKFAAQGKLNFGQTDTNSPPKLSVSGTVYANLSKVSTGAAKVLFLANAPDQVQLFTLEGELQTGFTDDAGNPMTPGVPQTTPLYASLITPVTNTHFINVQYTPALGQTLNVKSILAGGQFTLMQGGNPVTVGVPIQVGADTFEYPVTGTLAAGSATIHFLAGSWSDAAGNQGNDSTNNFQVTSLGHAFFIKINGAALLQGAQLASDLGLDASQLANNPIVQLTGNATLTIDSQQSLATLDATGNLSVIGLKSIAQASAHFVIDDSVPKAPQFYGAVAFHLGSTVLDQYGITADADATLQVNTSNTPHQVTLTGVTSNGVADPTFTLDPQTAQLEAKATFAFAVGSASVFSVDGNFYMRVNPLGLDLFASGDVKIAGTDVGSGSAVFIARKSGLAGQILLTAGGTNLPFAVQGVSFQGSSFTQFNSTLVDQTFVIPADFQGRLSPDFMALLTPVTIDGKPRVEAVISAGPPSIPPGQITAAKAYLVTDLSGSLNIENTLTLSGQMEIIAATGQFTLDGAVHAGLTGLGTINGTISFNATPAGMWGAAELDLQNQSNPSVSWSGHFVLQVNTASSPEPVPQYTIDNITGAITLSGTTMLNTGIHLGFGGSLTFGGVFDASGDFQFTLSPGQLNVSADAQMTLGPLGSMHLGGDLQINSAGLVAYGTLTFLAGQSDIGSAYGVALSGAFALEVNTTGTQQPLAGHNVPAGIEVTVDGSANFLNFASGSGTITLAALSHQLNLGFNVQFSLASVINLHASGAAALYTDGDPGIAADLTIDSSSGLPVASQFAFNFDAGGTIQLNTTHEERDLIVPGTGVVPIDRRTFTAAMSGNIKLLNVLTLSGGLNIKITNNAWIVQVPSDNQLSLDFFNIASVHAYGFFNSNGAFNIHVNGELKLGSDDFGVKGQGDIHVYNSADDPGTITSTPGNLFLDGSGYLGGTLFGVSFGGDVNLQYDGDTGRIHADIDVSVGIHIHKHTFLGDINIDVGTKLLTAHFTVGYLKAIPPIHLGEVDNGVLNLYVGQLAIHRGFDTTQTDESVDLSGGSFDGTSQTITVNMLGQSQTFTGVTSIVGLMGDGNDYAQIDSSVSVPVTIDGGSGNNTIVDNSPAAGALSADGGGVNQIQCGPGPDTITAGSGSYQITGGGGGDSITLNSSGSSGSSYFINESGGGSNALTINGTTAANQYRLQKDSTSGDGLVWVGDPSAVDGGGNHTADGVDFSGLQSLSVLSAGNGNTFDVGATVTPSWIFTGSSSAVNIGSAAPAAGGIVSGLGAALNVVGNASVNVDDTGNSAPQTGELTSGQLTGLGTAGVQLFGISSIDISLGSGGNNFTIAGTPAPVTLNSGSGNDTINLQGNFNPTIINAGAGNDTINVQQTGAPVTVNTGSGANTVNVGSLAPASGGTLSGIQSALTVTGSGSDTLNVDDSGDAAGRTGTLSSSAITGLGMAGISYSGMATLNLSLGSGNDTLAVTSTSVPTITTINTGAGNDTVNVSATGGQTNIVNPGGADTVNVGTASPGVVQGIQGTLNFSGQWFDTLNVDDTGDAAAQNATITGSSITGLGMGPQGITYGALANLNVRLGSGGNTVLVNGTSANTQTLINTGAGSDTVNVQATGRPTDIQTGGGVNTINVGSNAPATGGVVDHISGHLTVEGGGADTLNIDDSGSTGPKTGTLFASSIALSGIGIAYSGLANLDISLGAGGNNFLIAATSPGTNTTLNSGAGNDTIEVRSTAGPTTVNTGGGVNTVTVDNVLDHIQGPLMVNGSGADTLTVSDAASTGPKSGTLTPSTLTGLGMGSGGITYGGISSLNIYLGSGGNAFLIADTAPAAGTFINSGPGSDVINVRAITGATTVNTGSGPAADVVNISSTAPAPGGVVTGIQGPLTIAGNGNDTANIDDTASTSADTAFLTATNLSGLGMGPAGITYSGLANLNVLLGAGGNTFNVLSTAPLTSTFINTGAGSDIANVRTTAGPTTINTSAGTNTVNVGSVAPASGGVVDGIQGTLTILGSGSDTLSVDDTASAGPKTGTLTPTNLGGLAMGPGGVNYSGLASLNVRLGSGGNLFQVNDITPATHTSVDGGSSAADTVNATFANDFNGKLDLTSFEHGSINVAGNFNGTLNDTQPGHLETVNIGGSITQPGNLLAGSIDALTIGRDLAGSVTVTGTLGSVTIVSGSFTPTGSITAGNLNSLTLGPSHLVVGQNLAGTLSVTGSLGSVRVAGGTPGLIRAGHIGTVAAYGGFGPVVLDIVENGIERHVEMASPTAPYPMPNSSSTASSPYVNLQYFYESGTLANPQLTARITNNVSAAKDQYDLSLVTYNDAAKFNLSRLDSAGISGVRNVAIEGDLLTSVTPQAAAFFTLPTGAIDLTPAGIRLPQDNVAGVGIRDFVPDGYIQARSIQAIAFGAHSEQEGDSEGEHDPVQLGAIESGASPDAEDAERLLAPGTAIVQANDTFRVPFADLPQYHVGMFIATDEDGWDFEDSNIAFAVQSVLSPNATGTANIATPSNIARGAATALVTVTPAYDRWGRPEDSVVQSIAIRGDGASIQTEQWIAGGITSTGPLGDLTLSSEQGITNITAPSIFGSISTDGPITGAIQTTGLRTDPITGTVSNVPADLGGIYVDCSHWFPVLTATTIQSEGGLPGRIISRGNLISAIRADGGISGTIASQGNLGAYAKIGGSIVRLGGISSNGPLTGDLVVLGNDIGDLTFHGGLKAGRVAIKGNVLGNVLIDGGLDRSSAFVSGGQIGDPSAGTALMIDGSNKGIIAARANIRLIGHGPTGAVFNNVGAISGNPNAAALDAIFTDHSAPLMLDLSSLDLGGLGLILQDLNALKVGANGNLTGPVA